MCIIYYTYIFEYNTATKQENRVAYREMGINHHAKKNKTDLDRQYHGKTHYFVLLMHINKNLYKNTLKPAT